MAGRGPQSFKKRQKEQQRKEKQAEKAARKLERKRNPQSPDSPGGDADDDIEAYEIDESLDRPQTSVYHE